MCGSLIPGIPCVYESLLGAAITFGLMLAVAEFMYRR